MKENQAPLRRDPLRIVSACMMAVVVMLLVISTLFQCLSIYAITVGSPDVFGAAGWLLPVWIAALVLLPAAAIINPIVKKNEKWSFLPLALALVGAALALVVALTLRGAFPVQAGSNVSIHNQQGLSDWKLIYRHLSSVFAGVLTAIAAGLNHTACRNQRIRRENEQYESVYDLGGDPLFADMDKPKLKRSQKDALRKEKN